MEQLQQQVAQIAQDLNQLRSNFDTASASMTEAISVQGQKLTVSGTAASTMESDLKQLYKVADEAIRAANVKIGEMSIGTPEKPEHKWHFTRPNDLVPMVLAKEEDWKRWNEDIEDYADAVTKGMKDILKMVGKEKDKISAE